MQTSIIIPQLGKQAELTEPLVDQLRMHEPDAEIIIVDDGIGITASPRGIPGARIVSHDGLKRGLTMSWNLGIRKASHSRICLLNNDVRCLGPFLRQLNAQGGISGAKMRDDPDVKTFLLEGWCLCFSRDVYRAMVAFDESMTTYFSDTDFQFRANRRGYHLTACKVPLQHLGHKTAHDRKVFPDQKRVWQHDRKIFIKKLELIRTSSPWFRHCQEGNA